MQDTFLGKAQILFKKLTKKTPEQEAEGQKKAVIKKQELKKKQNVNKNTFRYYQARQNSKILRDRSFIFTLGLIRIVIPFLYFNHVNS